MQLKDFIKNTIESISESIVESQESLKDKGVIVNPEKTSVGPNGEKMLRAGGNRYVQDLEFDILVGVDENENAGGKGSLKVAGLIDVGGGLEESKTITRHNRIKFTVPVAFRTTETPREYSPNYGITAR